MKFISFSIIIFLFSLNSIFSQTLVHPVNLNFEQSQEGLVPFGWNFQNQFEKLGYQAYSTSVGALQGNYCLTMQSAYNDYRMIPNPDNKELQSVIYQEISAEYFRGKEVFFALKYRVLNPSEKNAALIFIQQENNDIKFFRLFNSDTLRNSDWTEASIKIMVDSLSKVIKFGFISFATAKVQFDDAIFNFTYDFTLNHPPVTFTEIVHKNLFDLAKIYGTSKYFYPSPFLKDFPWDALLHESIGKAVTENQNIFLKSIKSNFYSIVKNDSKSTQGVTSASNFVYTGLPIKTATPLSNQRISDIFISNKDYPGTLINFVNIIKEKYTEISLTVKYKFRPYAKNSKGGLWLRFDNAQSGSISENKAEPFIVNSVKWETAKITAKVPADAASMRIGLVLEGDGEVLFDDLIVKTLVNGEERNIDVRNSNFESPLVNNFISGWNFPQHSQNAGYSIILSDDAFEGKTSIKISSNKDNLITFPEVNYIFTDTLSDGSTFNTPITVPVSSLKNFGKPNYKIPENFAINSEDSYSRFAIIIELWNFIRHFSLKELNDIVLENAFLNAIYDANKATSLDQFQKVLKNLINITNDPNYRVWYGFDPPPYFPDFGIFVSAKKVFTIHSDTLGIPNGSQLIKVGDISVDSLIKTSLVLNKNNPQSNEYIIYKEVSNLLSGFQNTSKELEFKTPEEKVEIKKVLINSLTLKSISKPLFATELMPGIIYFNSAHISDEEFRQIIPKLQASDVKGIIIDLRGYSLLSEHILGLFTDSPQLIGFESEIPVYTAPKHIFVSNSIMQNNIKSVPKLKDKKVVFIVNEFSNSYSEIIAALARVNKIGQVIGTPTQGNISEVEQIVLPGYYFGSQSILKIKLQGDSKYLENPVAPEIKVEQTLKSAILDTDDQLEEAVKLIR